MNENILVQGYLAENELKINKRLSYFILAFLILCPAIVIADAAGLISYQTPKLIVLCLLIVLLSVLPGIFVRFCPSDKWNRRVCLITLEMLVCLISCNGIMEMQTVFFVVPIVSVLYVRKSVFFRTATICLLVMLALQVGILYQGQQNPTMGAVLSRANYQMLIEMTIQYLIVMMILYFVSNRMHEMVVFGYNSERSSSEDKEEHWESLQKNDFSMEEEEISYDLKGLFLEVDQTIDRLIRGKGKQLNLSVDYELPARLVGNREKIKSLMIRLLSDLVQFTGKGEVKLEVTYEKGILPKKGQNITVVCHIFCPENLQEALEGGNAVGIALAENWIQELNGVIHSETDPDTGATNFTVSFQQIVDAEETLMQVKERHREEQKRLIFDSRKKVQNIIYAKEVKVLVVDDSDVNRKLINSILKSYGMQAVCVSSGEEAMEKLKTKAFDFVILDHMMPVKGGIQIAKEIRQLGEPYYEMLPMMAMTSNMTNESRKLFKDNGFTEVISKPIKEDELRQAISHCMFI